MQGLESWVFAVVVVVVRGSQVLAMRRSPHKDAAPGVWETVSGRVELGESPADAARREMREETGLEATLEERPIDAYSAQRGDRPMAVVVYRARWTGGEVERSDEHDAHRWCTPAEFRALGAPARLLDAVQRAFESRLPPV